MHALEREVPVTPHHLKTFHVKNAAGLLDRLVFIPDVAFLRDQDTREVYLSSDTCVCTPHLLKLECYRVGIHLCDGLGDMLSDRERFSFACTG